MCVWTLICNTTDPLTVIKTTFQNRISPQRIRCTSFLAAIYVYTFGDTITLIYFQPIRCWAMRTMSAQIHSANHELKKKNARGLFSTLQNDTKSCARQCERRTPKGTLFIHSYECPSTGHGPSNAIPVYYYIVLMTSSSICSYWLHGC